MTLQDAEQLIQKGYDVEILGLTPYRFSGENPDSYVVFWRAKNKQPGGQYTICVVESNKKVIHKGNFEEHSEAQEALCRVAFPYQD